MNTTKLVAAVLAVLLVGGTLVAVGAAQDDDFETETEQETELREISVERDAESVEIESEQVNASTGVERSFEIAFETGDEVEIELTVGQEQEVNGSEQETELSYEVETERLIEYRGGAPNATDNGDTVSSYSLEDAAFEPIDYRTETTADNVTDHVITAETTDGVFTITLHVVGTFTDIQGTAVEPTEVKIDLAMEGYEFQANDTSLGLLSKLTTEREVEREDDEDSLAEEEGVEIHAGDVTGFFTWKRTATVDGQIATVNADVRPRDEAGERGILLSYPQGDSIVHDPKVGFRLSERTGMSTAAIVAALIVLGALAVVGIRRYR